MKKILVTLIAIVAILTLTACGVKNEAGQPSKDNNGTSQQENTNVNNNEKEEQDNQQNQQQEIENDEYIDEKIIEYDDTPNAPPEVETVVVEEVINCPGCVYAYFSDEGDKAKRIGQTLSPSDYTTDINNVKTGGGKQRHNFFGLVLSGNTISKAYACILKDSKIYCIQGSDDGAHHSNNIAILNKIFTSSQCRTISAGHTYTCTDGSYNGDTKTTGFASLHYETSCTIYGSDANTGKIICH